MYQSFLRIERTFTWEETKKYLYLSSILLLCLTVFLLNNNGTKVSGITLPKEEEQTVVDVVECTIPVKKAINSSYIPYTNYEEEILTDEYKDIEEIVKEISPEMDISKTSGISKADFIFLLNNCKYDSSGILKENANIIWEECQKRQLNEFAIVGIIATESFWANPEKSYLAENKKNIMSIKNDDGQYKTYDTYTECIVDVMRLLQEEYISEEGRYHTGGKLNLIADTYSENGLEWSSLVSECAEMSTRALRD